jgi:predicted aldo/keto reductase-like oxidoreductase
MEGNSELSIGKFLSRNPEVRNQLFIVSKASGAWKAESPKAVVAKVQSRLETSLQRMNTTYIDMYYGVHGSSEPSQLTEELRQWVRKAKEQKLIRFFGFSTHKNMAANLRAAAQLDWIDGIMTSYNFRLMQDTELRQAIDACYKAGIAVIAMKILGLRTDDKVETEADKKLVEPFLARGFTPLQANIKAVLADERIACACVGANNVAHLVSNAAAAIDGTELSQQDMDALRQYAKAGCTGYCAGCAHICDAACPQMPYVSDIMRYLMYYNSYGHRQRARKLFAKIPRHVRARLHTTDYGIAERQCPQKLPIGKLIAEAAVKLI